MEKPEVKYSHQYVKYEFIEEEKREISIEMAEKVSRLDSLEDELKAVKSDFKSQIDQTSADMKNLASKINNGWEMREIKCIIEYDYENGIVRHIRTDNGQEVKTRKMNQEERQMRIDDGVNEE